MDEKEEERIRIGIPTAWKTTAGWSLITDAFLRVGREFIRGSRERESPSRRAIEATNNYDKLRPGCPRASVTAPRLNGLSVSLRFVSPSLSFLPEDRDLCCAPLLADSEIWPFLPSPSSSSSSLLSLQARLSWINREVWVDRKFEDTIRRDWFLWPRVFFSSTEESKESR